jgi:hypothetical protein
MMAAFAENVNATASPCASTDDASSVACNVATQQYTPTISHENSNFQG